MYIVLRLSSFIKNVSNTRESNLLLHFFEMLKLLLKSLGAEEVFINELRPSLNIQSDSLLAKVFK